MTGNFLSFYSVKNEETLWAELHKSSLKDGKYGLGVVLIDPRKSRVVCVGKCWLRNSRKP